MVIYGLGRLGGGWVEVEAEWSGVVELDSLDVDMDMDMGVYTNLKNEDMILSCYHVRLRLSVFQLL